MPTQVIQIHRRVTGVGVPTTLAEGEPFYNSLGQELYIGDASGVPQTLVSESRQVGVTTDTVITGNKTIDVTLLHVVGGTAGQVLSTVDGVGAMAFITPAAAGSSNAADIVVTPALADGSDDVQQALEGLEDADTALIAADAALAAADVAMQTAIDGKVDLAGDTMTGALQLPAVPPTLATEAANKKYVDDAIAAVAGGGTTVTTDGISIMGDGVATPLYVNIIDGGVY